MNHFPPIENRQPRSPLAYLRIPLAIVLLALAAWALTAPPADAATITVNSTADVINNDGLCSLREAIIAANEDKPVDGCQAGKGADTISLPSGKFIFSLALSGTNEDAAATGDLDIDGDLTISGAGSNTTTIDANGLDRVFHVLDGKVTLKQLTVTGGGNNPGHGGGIYIEDGALKLDDTHITNNESNGVGGGVGARLSVDSVTVINSRITDNKANESGGGLYHSHTLLMTGSTVDNNEGSYGGGIANSFGESTILNSTISNNLAESATTGGGGISASGNVTIVNSTISGNSTNRGSGGGLNQGSTGTGYLYNVTITNNTADLNQENHPEGGGVFVGSDAELHFKHTIIAGNIDNSTTTKHHDCSGANFISLGYNLIQNTTGCTIGGQTTGNLTGVDPMLDKLANYGGPTETHALKAGSPAVDAGAPKSCTDHEGSQLVVDQRGYVRPVNGNVAADVDCDMGAYERLSPGAPTATFTPTPTATPTNTATPTPTVTPTTTTTPTTTQTPTATATPTDGPSPTPSATATDGPSPTPSATPTDGPSPTPSATATDGPSPTPSATTTTGPSPTPFPATDWVYLPVSLDQ